jgi:patatin-like phospholipase/acyl hydrolase
MSEVVRVFRDHGRKIFPAKFWLAGSFRARFKAESLRDVLSLLFPRDATVGDAKHALAIPVLNLSHGKQQVVKTPHSAGWDRDHRYPIIDVAMATAAAPIYFPIASMDNQLFADGGLFANAPDLIGLHEADKFLGADDEHIRMLSVGTLTETYAFSARRRRNLGVSAWLRPPSFPLIQTILAAQQQFSIQMVKHRLQNRYVRIDSQPHGTAMSDVGLDKADAKAQQVLLGFASKDVGDVIGSEQIKNFLQHNPARWIKER